jgi:uncharacterized OB-fold protein
MPTCPSCGNETAEGAVFCDQCGSRLQAPEAAAPETTPVPAGGSVVCPACGAGNVPGEAFCDFCGSPLEAPSPALQERSEPASVEEVAVTEPASEERLEEAAPAAEGQPTCPACGAQVLPGEAFCANCGASLVEPVAPSQPVPAAPEAVEPIPEAKEAVEPVAEEVPSVEERQVPDVTEVAAPMVEEVVPEVETAVPPAPITPQIPTCPACGVQIEAGDKFCSNCGAVLQGMPVAQVAEAAPSPPLSVGPRLVISASGAEIPLPAGDEVLIGREDPVSGIFPDVDLTPHGGEEGGVSRQHARLIVQGASYFVEDLDSTNYTFVNQQKLAPRTRHPLNDGDEIRCGRVALVLKA